MERKESVRRKEGRNDGQIAIDRYHKVYGKKGVWKMGGR